MELRANLALTKTGARRATLVEDQAVARIVRKAATPPEGATYENIALRTRLLVTELLRAARAGRYRPAGEAMRQLWMLTGIRYPNQPTLPAVEFYVRQLRARVDRYLPKPKPPTKTKRRALAKARRLRRGLTTEEEEAKTDKRRRWRARKKKLGIARPPTRQDRWKKLARRYGRTYPWDYREVTVFLRGGADSPLDFVVPTCCVPAPVLAAHRKGIPTDWTPPAGVPHVIGGADGTELAASPGRLRD